MVVGVRDVVAVLYVPGDLCPVFAGDELHAAAAATDVVVVGRVKPKPVQAVLAGIEKQTELRAVDRDGFFWTVVGYYVRNTGIPVNFGITVRLGFLVGSAIAGQNVLSVHARKPEAVRRAQGDGAAERAAGADGLVAGIGSQRLDIAWESG